MNKDWKTELDNVIRGSSAANPFTVQKVEALMERTLQDQVREIEEEMKTLTRYPTTTRRHFNKGYNSALDTALALLSKHITENK